MIQCEQIRLSHSSYPLALSHGQTCWLLTRMGFRQGADGSTFNNYIKSLRKIGIPFEKNPDATGSRQAVYNFEALMELSLLFILRGYGNLPDAVSAGLRNFRAVLQPMYREALSKREAVGVITGLCDESLKIGGVYVDLNIRYVASEELQFGPPKIISAFAALRVFAQAEAPTRVSLPINLSVIADKVIENALDLPEIGRGRPSKNSLRAPIGVDELICSE